MTKICKIVCSLYLVWNCAAIQNANAQRWSPVGAGLLSTVFALEPYNGELYAGGIFNATADLNISAKNIARWNGTDWAAVGTGMNGRVAALTIYNNELYAVGSFTTAGGTTAKYVAKWDGILWSGLGAGMNNAGSALAVFNNELYAGGTFTTADGNTANYITKWNGIAWEAVGTGMNNSVNALAVYNNELYAGGAFTTADGNTANYIAKWNGAAWTAVNTGMDNSVNALTVYNNELYAGGIFTTADGNAANYIAKWNGAAWTAVGTGMSGSNVRALKVYNGELYTGGNFSAAGGTAANHIAKWNGTIWSALSTGMDNQGVASLGLYNNELYAGGFFTMASGKSANKIAKWVYEDAAVTAIVNPLSPKCAAINVPVKVIVKNFSNCLLSFSITPVTVKVDITGASTQSINTIVNSGMLLPAATQTITVGSINLSALGIHAFKAYTELNSDVFHINDTLASVDVIVQGLPMTTATGGTTICPGESATMSAFGATTYSWMPGNLSGATVTVNPTSTTTYTITGTNGSGCSSSTLQTLVVDVCAGILQTEANISFVVYPNPSTGFVTIDFNNNYNDQIKLSIINQLGQVVHSRQTMEKIYQLDLSAQTNGVYYIQLQTKDSIFQEKIVLQK